MTSINLFAIVKYEDIQKYGFDPIAEAIVEDMKKLECGIELPNGEKIYGAVSALSGDKEGIHLVCGFKRSFSAEHSCQYCLVTLEEMQIMTTEDYQRLRTPETHAKQIAEMKAATNAEDRRKLSQPYGINKECRLTKLTDFDPTTGAPPDIGHDFYLGIVPLEVKKFLEHFCIKNNWMSLDIFNERVANFDYGYSEKSSKPSPIKRDHITGNKRIKQTASQMWLLAIILPFTVTDFINEENAYYLDHYIRLLEIMINKLFGISNSLMLGDVCKYLRQILYTKAAFSRSLPQINHSLWSFNSLLDDAI